ncbi:MAG: YifB family Mg chelatase-like AAA ATPase, partial [Planctomycetota bacterium]
RVHGASTEGTGALLVTIEARFSASKDEAPTEVHLTGLPDNVLRESRGRLLCILGATRLRLGPGRLYLHLTPAARRKSGEALDLPLVIAAAVAGGHLSQAHVAGTVFVGEVGIDGRLHPTPGGLAAAVAARARGIRRVIAPVETAAEAAAIEDMSAYGAASIEEVLQLLTTDPAEPGAAPPMAPTPFDPTAARAPSSLDDVRGQEEGKLALEVAAAGGHGLLLVGPPGAGKSMLARRLVDLLPEMTLDERIEVTSILSATGRWPRGLSSRRPFRAPHHTTSFAGLIGGGSPITPGEITLAHRGVLFLDELPEFGRETLEGLRQPMEEGAVHIARAARRTTLPARFQLVAAMNPCPCGYHGHARIPCHCPPATVRRYQQRISGPLLDRIEMRVSLQPAPVDVLVGSSNACSREGAPQGRSTDDGSSLPEELRGARMGARVLAARIAARRRHANGGRPNAELEAEDLDEAAQLTPQARDLLRQAAESQGLSARAIQAIRRVARTVADLAAASADDGARDEADDVDESAVATALALRGGGL